MSSKKQVKPLRDFLDDRSILIQEVFSSIEDHQLKKLIPDILKTLSMEQLKAECLMELLGMSKRRIVNVMQGCEGETSSESDSDSSDESDSEFRNSKERKLGKEIIGIDPDLEKSTSRSYSKEIKQPLLECKIETEAPVGSAAETIDVQEAEENSDRNTPSIILDEGIIEKKFCASLEMELDLNLNNAKITEGKNELEILELELRARVIRSLIDRESKKKMLMKSPQANIDYSDKEKEDESDYDEKDDDVIIIDKKPEEIDLTLEDDEPSECNVLNRPRRRNRASRWSSIPQDEGSQNATSDTKFKLTEDCIIVEGGSIGGTDSDNLEISKEIGDHLLDCWCDRYDRNVKRVISTNKLINSIRKRIKTKNSQEQSRFDKKHEMKDMNSIDS